MVKPGLYNAFETGDQRKTAWIKTNVVASQNYNYPNKYKVRMNATVTEYYMMLRLAEQYLIRAEARARQNKLPEAISDLNVIRARAGLGPLTAVLNQDQVLAAVAHEYKEGDRDLVRLDAEG